jgi:hypothetical protein
MVSAVFQNQCAIDGDTARMLGLPNTQRATCAPSPKPRDISLIVRTFFTRATMRAE